jgi:hypothetical protein
MNLNVDCALWGIMMCQCRFTDHDKCTSLVGNTENVCVCMREGERERKRDRESWGNK